MTSSEHLSFAVAKCPRNQYLSPCADEFVCCSASALVAGFSELFCTGRL